MAAYSKHVESANRRSQGRGPLGAQLFTPLFTPLSTPLSAPLSHSTFHFNFHSTLRCTLRSTLHSPPHFPLHFPLRTLPFLSTHFHAAMATPSGGVPAKVQKPGQIRSWQPQQFPSRPKRHHTNEKGGRRGERSGEWIGKLNREMGLEEWNEWT